MLGFGPLGGAPLGDDDGTATTGTGAAVLSALTCAGTGTLGYTGTGAAVLSALTASGTGTLGATGTGAAILSALTASGTGTVKKKTGGSGGGSTPGTAAAGEKYATKVTMPELGTITTLILDSDQAKSVNTRMALYANAGGVPGELMDVTGDKTSVVVGENEYALTTPRVIESGTIFWIALHADASINWLLGTEAGGSYKNADVFAGGISNPFGSGTLLGTKAPLLAVFYEGVPPAVITNGMGAATLSALTASGTGTLGTAGTGAAILSALTASGTGTLGYTGTGSAVLSELVVSGLGAWTVTGTGAAVLDQLAVVGSGTFLAPITGTGAAVLDSLTGSGTGTLGYAGTGAATLAELVCFGLGGGVFVGTGAAVLDELVAAGTGTHGTVSTKGRPPRRFGFLSGGDLQHGENPAIPPRQDLREIWKKPAPAPIEGSGSAVLESFTISGRGTVGRTGTGRASLRAFGAAGRGTHYDIVASDNEHLLLAS